MIGRRVLLSVIAAATAVAAGLGAGPARAAEPIRVGEMNSYTTLPAFTLPYRDGWRLALEEINAAGGVNGRPLEVISRDDGGNPGDAVNAANELVSREGVALLMGTYFSHVGLAVSDFAKQRRVLFVGAEPLTDAFTWSQGNRYTFRLRPPVLVQTAALAEEAAKLPARRWATVAPNYEYGQAAVAAFKRHMERLRPDIEWVGEQWPAQGKIDSGATVQALAQADPEAIFNVTFGADLSKFVREGNVRGLFEGRVVASLLTGEPEYLDPLKDETPEGWIVTGYPWQDIETPEHTAFVEAYRARFDDYPRLGSIVGYATMKAVAAILEKADATDVESLIAAAKGVRSDTPLGPVTFRAVDHQSTFGVFVGRTALVDGRGVMVDWRYADGADYLPSEEEARRMRPAD